MTKYERRQFFERLVQLRALYLLRGSDDSVTELPIDEAIAYGEGLLADAHVLAQVLGPELPERQPSTTVEPRQG